MTDIPEWAKQRACDLSTNEGARYPVFHPSLAAENAGFPSLRAFARYIAEHEEPPVDPLLIEARKVAALGYERAGNKTGALNCINGDWDDQAIVSTALAALRRGMELARETKP